MVAINNADLFKTGLDALTGSIPGENGQLASSFTNCVWTFGDKEATEEQKVKSGIDFGIQVFLKLFGKNESNAADAEVKQNQADVENLNSNLNEIAQNTSRRVQEKISEVQNNITTLQENLKAIEEKQEEKVKIQQEIAKQTEALNTAIATLNDPNSTKAERKEARQAISGVDKVITGLTKQVQELTKATTDLGKSVNELENANAGLNEEATGIIEEGTQATEQAVQQVATEQAENATTATTAGINETTGIAANTAAATIEAGSKATSFIPVAGMFTSATGEATAQKLFKVGEDQTGAGVKRFAGFGDIATKLLTSNNLIGSNNSTFTNFTSSLGGLFNDSQNFSQTFYGIYEPFGTWLSSATVLEEQSEVIAEVTEEVSEETEETEETEEDGNDNKKKVEIDTSALEKLSA